MDHPCCKRELGLTSGIRVTMTPVNGIYGIGDSTNKKEAEKLAALSSLLQLISTGYVSLPLPFPLFLPPNN